VLIDELADGVQEVDENPVGDLAAGLADRTSGDNTSSDVKFEDGFEHLIQLVLKGAFEEVEEVEDQDGKGEGPAAGESGGASPMFLFKLLGKNEFSETV